MKNKAQTHYKHSTGRLKNEHIMLLFVIALFLLSVLLRSWGALYDKRCAIYMDELRYMQIAKNIWLNGDFSIYGIENDFQKITYSILLAPFYAIKNSIVRVKAISLFNSVLVSSSIFPGYCIARKLTKNRLVTVLSLVILFFMPDMCFSMIFMSENLYLPLGLWQIYLFICLFQETAFKKQMVLAVSSGILSYLLYLTKEICLFFPMAYVLIECLRLCFEKKEVRRRLCVMGCYIAGFAVLFLLVKCTLFSGMENSYSQTSLSQIGTPYRFGYMLYCAVYNGLFLLVGYFYFPLVYPAFRIGQMGKQKRHIYAFLMLCILIGMAVIAFTISVREDLGKEFPRQHQRYYMPFFFPLVLLFLDTVMEDTGRLPKRTTVYFSVITGVTATFAALFAGVLGKVGTGSVADNTTLRYYISLTTKLFKDVTERNNQFLLNSGELLVKAVILLFVIGGTILLLRHQKKNAVIIFTAVVLSVQIVNGYLVTRKFRQTHSISIRTQDQAYRLDNCMQTLEGNILLVQRNKLNDNVTKLLDTYLSMDYCVAASEDLYTLLGEKAYVDLYTDKFTTVYKLTRNVPYSAYDHFDYIISEDALSFAEGTAEEIIIEGVDIVHVYHVQTPHQLWIEH